jgi:squalene-hopene/tetraprenyl-beta-curcumene cyclase
VEQLAKKISNEGEIDHRIKHALHELLGTRRADGHWVFDLEADVTIPSEYILLRHFLGDLDFQLEQRLAVYIRGTQGEHGGWPLFHGGDLNISASVKAYYALKIVGDDPEAPHMVRAREAILARGGAEKANVFTRFALALFGQVPWRATPVMPVEIMLLPKWSPFHLSKVSYWSRTVIVPLLILASLKPRAVNPRGIHVRELFSKHPDDIKQYNTNPTGSPVGEALLAFDKVLRTTEGLFPERLRNRAIDRAVEFIRERLNGEDGLGGIFPAMANAVMAFRVLGISDRDPEVLMARKAVDKLVSSIPGRKDFVYCQPCVSPVWDTCLAVHAALEAGTPVKMLESSFTWLVERQILEVAGDWKEARPSVRPGGWAFQYRNPHYPDVDDTAVVAAALHRADPKRYRASIERAAEWVIGMQSRNGGWGAFDADNTHDYLNHIPFADHGALLDPPTVDVSARCLSMLAQLGYARTHQAIVRGVEYLKREQELDGSWFGRWGANYVYGTWSALCALNAVGEPLDGPIVRRGVAFLLQRQRPDGGWGEGCETYESDRKDEILESTPSQTAWALLGLMAAGDVNHQAVRRGIEYLERHPMEGPRWKESYYTGVGFPRVFYLRYYGYAAYFPLWALARYRSLQSSGATRVSFGL